MQERVKEVIKEKEKEKGRERSEGNFLLLGVFLYCGYNMIEELH